MRRAGFSLLLLAFALTLPMTDASAQSAGQGALFGGAIGAGTGAIVGDMQRRRRNFYWSNGRCWQRSSRNEFFPVSNRYCR